MRLNVVGLEIDLTLEHSLFKYGCYVKIMAGDIQKHPGNKGSSMYFVNKERDEWFGGRWADVLMLYPLFDPGHVLMDCLVLVQVER